MHARVYSATTIGVDAQLIEIEADLSAGLASFTIVGLADKAINESKERIRAALKNSGNGFPVRSITVNLAPANIKKQDVLFDVPISMVILLAAGEIPANKIYYEETVFLGELALDGSIRPVCGVLAIADYIRAQGKRRLIVPSKNAAEAALVEGIEVIGVSSVTELLAHVRGIQLLVATPPQFEAQFSMACAQEPQEDIADVAGQWIAKRALLLAAAGHHNVIMIGPPGSGKTMLAQRFRTLLPPLSFEEVIGITKVYSVAGMLDSRSLITRRPVRAPHHTVSQAGLIGGGSVPRPGEVSLAHHGILFLDELTEFSRATIEVLRQPMESGQVRISRAQGAVAFPASFLLIAAMNPCPCGYFGNKDRCRCSTQQVQSYIGKLSGPLLDRIDLHVPVRAVQYEEVIIEKKHEGPNSVEMACVAMKARERQFARGQRCLNGQLQGKQVVEFCRLSSAAHALVAVNFDRLGLSMRGYHKVLKIARTIADLVESELIEVAHIQEALSFRTLSR
ncbi:MAG: magnesium chelatase family protein [Candidatus Dependentiae bacterium]|nr:magnesium chelatase family protein [Candidatus Dependentiae bacterium]